MSTSGDSQQNVNELILRDDEEMVSGDDSDNKQSGSNYMLREQDRFLPICNIIKIMKVPVPENGKIAKDARECIQECVSEFISFITSEAIERSIAENRKTVNGDDLLYAFANLGFDNYVEPLLTYLHKFRESTKSDRNLYNDNVLLQDDSSSDIPTNGIVNNEHHTTVTATSSSLSAPRHATATIYEVNANNEIVPRAQEISIVSASANSSHRQMYTRRSARLSRNQLSSETSSSTSSSMPFITTSNTNDIFNADQLIFFETNEEQPSQLSPHTNYLNI